MPMDDVGHQWPDSLGDIGVADGPPLPTARRPRSRVVPGAEGRRAVKREETEPTSLFERLSFSIGDIRPRPHRDHMSTENDAKRGATSRTKIVYSTRVFRGLPWSAGGGAPRSQRGSHGFKSRQLHPETPTQGAVAWMARAGVAHCAQSGNPRHVGDWSGIRLTGWLTLELEGY